MTLTVTQMAMLIIGSLICLELIKLATSYFFGRITRDDYITRAVLEAQCKMCHETSKNDHRGAIDQLDGLYKEIRETKQIVLIVALKSGISPAELKGLIG
jgi:hypothetical protein